MCTLPSPPLINDTSTRPFDDSLFSILRSPSPPIRSAKTSQKTTFIRFYLILHNLPQLSNPMTFMYQPYFAPRFIRSSAFCFPPSASCFLPSASCYMFSPQSPCPLSPVFIRFSFVPRNEYQIPLTNPTPLPSIACSLCLLLMVIFSLFPDSLFTYLPVYLFTCLLVVSVYFSALHVKIFSTLNQKSAFKINNQ